jgi:hypothetical protein
MAGKSLGNLEHMSLPLIRINGLVKKYGERVAIDGISFSIEEGEIFGLLGPNGGGRPPRSPSCQPFSFLMKETSSWAAPLRLQDFKSKSVK